MCLSQTFKYFAFGSNLLTQRIHINNPTAKRFDVGVLDKYRLDFGYFAQRWGGYVATIVPDDEAVVWGAIWDIGLENLEDLDRQEGVKDAVYRPLEVSVKTLSGEVVTCRCYCLVNQPSYPEVPNVPNLLPSKVYMDTVIRGAKESQLPEDYIKMLEAIPNNGYDGPVNYGIN
uniref:gamma-glutamylcyclotransferase n=1 Tax=Lygus hesperus TaxID=30085 RepID=A0A0A9YU02_LYGHE